MTPEAVRTEELSDALALLFQRFDSRDRAARIENALCLVERGELDPRGLFVLRSRGRVVGAVLCLALPGAGGLVWPPQCLPGTSRAEQEDALLQYGADWLRGHNVKIAQALLSVEETAYADALPRNGFPHVTRLWFLRRDLTLLPPFLDVSAGLVYRPYELSDPDLFHRTLQYTYEGTLDCPELNGVRAVEEIVAGHRGLDRLNANFWFLALADGDPIGVLLLAESSETHDWETSYVGVVPEARRRGFGREMMIKAIADARAAGASWLTLSVDARNRPAWDLYRDLGFESFDSREVFLAVWK